MKLTKRWERYYGIDEEGVPFDLYKLTLGMFELRVEWNESSKSWSGTMVEEGIESPLGGEIEDFSVEKAQAALMAQTDSVLTDSLILLREAMKPED